ncbi:enoyl-CoA hydratase-related protein [Klenkia sp. PcliD-1-E]|uniref:enoyl-CoA hydratase-related protein n=1 Tax=Klenkia sp. PcliD-1-E TaxID=2954492 RepID=UPI002096835B|nr:enoyl-CoA hydratase-related protein [Klenkia sp. PcliD-1-E]MCO7220157.1 enoyl-CoA hydratase-related protein [Klenkia sp. PcliD-1-E]
MSDWQQVSYAVDGGVATLTLDRPERRNAYTTVMARELAEVAEVADADDAVRVLVVTGAGKDFCVGADLAGAGTFDRSAQAEEAGTIDGVPRDWGGIGALPFAALRKPVIAAVRGAAVGIGATMTLPMDIRIASDTARFGFVFTRRGIVPEAASSWFLPRVVGISQAMEWVATGRVFGAEEALAGRLVSRVVPDGELLDTARGLAHEIADNTSGVSVATSRQLLWSMLSAASPWDAHRAESRALVELGSGPDAAEGVASFLEKRPADFRAPLDGVGLGWPAPPEDLA